MPRAKQGSKGTVVEAPQYVFSENNSLSPIGEKIFLDRYAIKDGSKESLKVGDTVVVCTDTKTGRREIGVVTSYLGQDVQVELRDGTIVDRLLEHIDKPLEAKPTDMMARVARGIASVETTPEKQTEWENNFRWLLDGYKFIPGGRILTTAGSDQKLTCYNCFTGDTLVHVKEGIVPIGSLYGRHEVLSEGGVYRPADFKSYGRQKVYRIRFENGATYRATADHQWIVSKEKGGTERVTTLALLGRRIPINPRPKPHINADFRQGVQHGLVFGDGAVQHGYAHIKMLGDSRALAGYFPNARPVSATATYPAHTRVISLPKQWKHLPSQTVTPSYWRGFVAGLIAADGHVDARGYVMIHNRNHLILRRIADEMAVAGFVPGKITLVREQSPFDGTDKPLYRLTILRQSVAIDDLLNTSHRRHWQNAPDQRQATVKVTQIDAQDEEEEVFCCVEPETHTITIGHGYLTGQCYVIPSPHDSRGGILRTLGQMNEIFSRGGGVGINLSSLRPRYSYVKGVNGRSSGAVSWGSLYSFSTGLIEQGGCLVPETLVFTENGTLRLDEIVTHSERGWQEKVNVVMTDQGSRPSRQVYNNGLADTLQVLTSEGLQITGTPNHKVKVMTSEGPAWRRLDELQSGDAIMVKLGQHHGQPQQLVQPKLQHFNQDPIHLPTALDQELAFFLGYLAGDGFMCHKEGDWRLGVAVAHSSYLIEEMPKIIGRLFPGVNVRKQQKPNDASVTYVVSNRAVTEFLQMNGFTKPRSADVVIPRLIRQSPATVVGAYLRGLFEADGGLSHHYPALTSTSRRLIEEIAALLIGLGCPVRIDQTQTTANSYGDRPKWRLRVHSFRGLASWQANIGCDPRSRFAACLTFVPDLSRETTYVLPNPSYWTSPVLEAITLPQVDSRATGERFKASDPVLRRSLLRYERGDRQLTLSAYENIRKHNQVFADHAQPINDLWFVSVDRVVKAGLAPTLDLEVDDNHTYLANGLVTHNSRRGALMLILNVWHPDVLEFINSKREAGKITNANISVGITDDFMAAVKNDGEWDLIFPDTADPEYNTTWDGNLDAWKAAGKKVNVYKTIKARELWDSLITSAWASAEPGLYFVERSNKMSNSWYYAPLPCTNPCVTGDTLIYTAEGLQRADVLAKQNKAIPMVIDGRFGVSEPTVTATPMFYTGRKRVYKLQTVEGYSIRATADHRIMTDRGWVELSKLSIGDKVHILNRKGAFGQYGSQQIGQLLGWLIGDGVIKHNERLAVLSFFHEEKRELAPLFASYINELNANQPAVNHRIYHNTAVTITGRDEARVKSRRLFEIAEAQNLTVLKHQVPNSVLTGSEAMQRGFLQALFTADGTVQQGVGTRASVRLAANAYPLLQDVQRLLLNFGIASHIFKNRRVAGYRPMPDGHGGLKQYLCAAQHELVITKQNMTIFKDEIGFLSQFKQEKLTRLEAQLSRRRYTEHFTARVLSIEAEGIEEVYDVSVPEKHTITGNGIIVHNCGEQPLPAWGVCNLGAINLSKFVDHETHDVEWEKLRQAVSYAIRFLDNVIDWTPYFFEENEKQQKGERRVGMNTMGLAEMMIHLGIRYGSEESTAFIDRLYRFISGTAYQTSAEIAAEKGAFPYFEADKFLQSGFMESMPKEIRQMVKEKGMRNVTLLTQAPNGTIGTMAGTSTGIEPFYSWTYFRTSRLGTHEENVQIVSDWLRANPGKELPNYFVTAMDLRPEEHVNVQAAIQRWVDSAISKTCNTPEDYTVEQTKTLYEKMYDMGCKGGTIYRDKSRDVQVLNLEKVDENKAVNNDTVQAPAASQTVEQPAPVTMTAAGPTVKSIQSAQEQFRIKPRPRPAVVSGTTEEITTGMGKLFVTINEDEHGPFEIFATVGKSGSETHAMTEGTTRMITLALRSGIEIQSIIKHLKGIRGSVPVWQNGELILSVPDAIAKALERFIDRKNSLGLEVAAVAEAPAIAQPSLIALADEPAPASQATSLSADETGSAVAMEAPKSVIQSSEMDLCPECGQALHHKEGCLTCDHCGFSKCG